MTEDELKAIEARWNLRVEGIDLQYDEDMGALVAEVRRLRADNEAYQRARERFNIVDDPHEAPSPERLAAVRVWTNADIRSVMRIGHLPSAPRMAKHVAYTSCEVCSASFGYPGTFASIEDPSCCTECARGR